MKRLKILWKRNAKVLVLGLAALSALIGLLTYKLSVLIGGLSAGEIAASTAAVGWHGIWADPFYLPLKLVRSVVFFAESDHGQILTRLPNVLFGALTISAFGWLIWLWHGPRTAFFTTVLFATSAWTLHVSRLASFDVLYLWAIPTLLVIQALLRSSGNKAIVWYGSVMFWGILLYIPGLVWLVLLQIYSQRALLKKAWHTFTGWPKRSLSILAFLVWLPLLIINLARPGNLIEWLGLPAHFPSIAHLIKQFIGVFVHLFVRGPQYPELWLARAPILDIFTLLCCGLGIYFYASHNKASRSQRLGLLFIAGFILVGLGGPVSLSLLVPLLYIVAAAGIAYLLQTWLKVFPRNPLARGLGIGLISLAVALGCAYNLRAYFIAWPHNQATPAVFKYHR